MLEWRCRVDLATTRGPPSNRQQGQSDHKTDANCRTKAPEKARTAALYRQNRGARGQSTGQIERVVKVDGF